MNQLSLLQPIDELHLKAQAMPVTEGRVIQVQLSYLRDFRRVRVIDDFETSYATTVVPFKMRRCTSTKG